VSFAPFIDVSYGIALVFLLASGVLTWRRYRRAVMRLRSARAG
jgi:hypothetical protein